MSATNIDQMVEAAWHYTEMVYEKEAETGKMPSSIINVWHEHRIGKWWHVCWVFGIPGQYKEIETNMKNQNLHRENYDQLKAGMRYIIITVSSI